MWAMAGKTEVQWALTDWWKKMWNLSIALSLAEDLKANHFTVILVREGDYSVGDQGLPTVAERKRSDTKTGWLWWNR